MSLIVQIPDFLRIVLPGILLPKGLPFVLILALSTGFGLAHADRPAVGYQTASAAGVLEQPVSSQGAGSSINLDDHPPAPIKIDSVTVPGTDVGFTLALIPAGSFVLGSPDTEEGRDADEGPVQTVIVEEFWIGTHEITFDEFAIYRFRDRDNDIAADPSFTADAVTRPSPPYEDPAHGLGAEGHPATGMTQWAALQYARWLSAKTGDFYRLPTEAEWEYACRAGTESAYSFGDEPSRLDDVAWYGQNSSETFHPVGQKAPNAWGLYDMHGNVSEWTLDQYDKAFYESLNPGEKEPWAKPSKRHPRTVRGGAFDDSPEDLRCGARLRSSLNWKRRDPQIPKSSWWNTDSQFLGFRLVRVANPPARAEVEEFFDAMLRD